MVFGVSLSPFLLNATIKHHLELYGPSYPELAQKLLQSFYIDDVMTGVDNEEEGFSLYTDAKALMRRGGFNLCKFVTNHAPLQERIEVAENTSTRDSSHHETYAQSTLGQPKGSSSKVKKVLGVCWDTVNDELLFEFNYLFDHIIYAEPTKRQVVSTVGRFYDPLGFIQPVIIRYKVFIQELCRRKVIWDETLDWRGGNYWQGAYVIASLLESHVAILYHMPIRLVLTTFMDFATPLLQPMLLWYI